MGRLTINQKDKGTFTVTAEGKDALEALTELYEYMGEKL